MCRLAHACRNTHSSTHNMMSAGVLTALLITAYLAAAPAAAQPFLTNQVHIVMLYPLIFDKCMALAWLLAVIL